MILGALKSRYRVAVSETYCESIRLGSYKDSPMTEEDILWLIGEIKATKAAGTSLQTAERAINVGSSGPSVRSRPIMSKYDNFSQAKASFQRFKVSPQQKRIALIRSRLQACDLSQSDNRDTAEQLPVAKVGRDDCLYVLKRSKTIKTSRLHVIYSDIVDSEYVQTSRLILTNNTRCPIPPKPATRPSQEPAIEIATMINAELTPESVIDDHHYESNEPLVPSSPPAVASYREKIAQLIQAAIIVQRMVRSFLSRRRDRLQYLMRVSLTVTLAVRRLRKAAKVRVLRVTLLEMQSHVSSQRFVLAVKSLMLSSLRAAKLIQRTVKAFFACKKARITCLLLKWAKLEHGIRRRLHESIVVFIKTHQAKLLQKYEKDTNLSGMSLCIRLSSLNMQVFDLSHVMDRVADKHAIADKMLIKQHLKHLHLYGNHSSDKFNDGIESQTTRQ
jgi:hypothetical protein